MATLRIPPSLVSGRALLTVALWTVLGHLCLLLTAVLCDTAVGGDLASRWLPWTGASLMDPWSAGPRLARLLALGVGGLTGFALSKSGVRTTGIAAAGALVLVPWLHRGGPLFAASDPLFVQPWVPSAFWLLGLVVGWGLQVGRRDGGERRCALHGS